MEEFGNVYPLHFNTGVQIVPIANAAASAHRVVGLHVSSDSEGPVRIELQAVHPGTPDPIAAMGPRVLEPGAGFDLVGALADLPAGTYLRVVAATEGITVSGSVHVIAVKAEG